jgi:hypothetical protein
MGTAAAVRIKSRDCDARVPIEFRNSLPELSAESFAPKISGSARESGGHRDFGGFGVLDGQESSSRRCWGNVGTRVRCGFPSAEGEPRISG